MQEGSKCNCILVKVQNVLASRTGEGLLAAIMNTHSMVFCLQKAANLYKQGFPLLHLKDQH